VKNERFSSDLTKGIYSVHLTISKGQAQRHVRNFLEMKSPWTGLEQDESLQSKKARSKGRSVGGVAEDSSQGGDHKNREQVETWGSSTKNTAPFSQISKASIRGGFARWRP